MENLSIYQGIIKFSRMPRYAQQVTLIQLTGYGLAVWYVFRHWPKEAKKYVMDVDQHCVFTDDTDDSDDTDDGELLVNYI